MEHIVSEGGVVIFNPTAGRGQGARRKEEAQAHLGPAFEWVPTQRPGHATEDLLVERFNQSHLR